MWSRRKREREISQRAERLHAIAVTASRERSLYVELGAPDTPEGRFELLTLHLNLLIERLRAEGREGEIQGQALFDRFLSHLDGAMREMGVSDISMARRMKRLGEAYYGRAKGLREALMELPDTTALRAFCARTLPTADSERIADRIVARWVQLTEIPGVDVMAGDLVWKTT